MYIALPNHMHQEYTIRAAQAGIHVLCEKPMALTVAECQSMIHACRDNRVKLMIAYRLHFEKSNLKAIKLAQSGKLGDLRIFSSVFTMQVKEGNSRLQRSLGGGTLYDIGIYCINAARYLFQDEPLRVFANRASSDDVRVQRSRGDGQCQPCLSQRPAGDFCLQFWRLRCVNLPDRRHTRRLW